LHGWDGLDPASRSKPGYVGKLTNALVYERLPDGVLEQLRTQNPKDIDGKRKFKHHQFLTDEIGNPHLEKHLSKVVGLMQASDTWIEFKRMFKKPRAAVPAGLKVFGDVRTRREAGLGLELRQVADHEAEAEGDRAPHDEKPDVRRGMVHHSGS
jgi:hypothetical protein